MSMSAAAPFVALLLAGALAIPAAGQETSPAMLAAAEKDGKVVWLSLHAKTKDHAAEVQAALDSLR